MIFWRSTEQAIYRWRSWLCVFIMLSLLDTVTGMTSTEDSAGIPDITGPRNTVVKAGDSAQLGCSIPASGDLIRSWYFKDKLIALNIVAFEPNKYDLDYDNRGVYNLKIKDIKPEDAGVYTCRVSSVSANGTDSRGCATFVDVFSDIIRMADLIVIGKF